MRDIRSALRLEWRAQREESLKELLKRLDDTYERYYIPSVEREKFLKQFGRFYVWIAVYLYFHSRDV